MPMSGLAIITIISVFGWGQVREFEVVPHGVHFQTGKQTAYLEAIHQIETDGDRLYFRGSQDEFILVTNPDGKVQAKIGGKGGHPSEFPSGGILAIAVSQRHMAAIDKSLNAVRLFEDHVYQRSFSPKTYHLSGVHNTSNAFAFSEKYLVLPSLDDHFLAKRYDLKTGRIKGFGEAIHLGLKESIAELANATLWCRDESYWYAAHKFFPLVTVFNAEFAMVNQFQIDHLLTQQYINYISEFEPNEHFTRPRPIVSDIKMFRGFLFLMVDGQLFQFDSQKGALLSTTKILARGKGFENVSGQPLYIPFFTITNDGRMFAAHPGLLWGHDFWRIELPHF